MQKSSFFVALSNITLINITDQIKGLLETTNDINEQILAHQLIAKLLAFKRDKKPYAIILQPGAGAPVNSFITEWRQAGLAGCTAELCALAALDNRDNIIVINSMHETEQNDTSEKVKEAAQQVDLINDSYFVMPKILSPYIQTEVFVSVNDRSAYKPQAFIFNSAGELFKHVTPSSELRGTGDPKVYIQNIQDELAAADPFLTSESKQDCSPYSLG